MDDYTKASKIPSAILEEHITHCPDCPQDEDDCGVRAAINEVLHDREIGLQEEPDIPGFELVNLNVFVPETCKNCDKYEDYHACDAAKVIALTGLLVKVMHENGNVDKIMADEDAIVRNITMRRLLGDDVVKEMQCIMDCMKDTAREEFGDEFANELPDAPSIPALPDFPILPSFNTNYLN